MTGHDTVDGARRGDEASRRSLALLAGPTRIELGRADEDVVILGAKSFLINFPVSFTGNYIIQLKMPLRRRFVASAWAAAEIRLLEPNSKKLL